MDKLQEIPNQSIDSMILCNKISIGDNDAKYLGEAITKCVTLTSLNLNL